MPATAGETGPHSFLADQQFMDPLTDSIVRQSCTSTTTRLLAQPSSLVFPTVSATRFFRGMGYHPYNFVELRRRDRIYPPSFRSSSRAVFSRSAPSDSLQPQVTSVLTTQRLSSAPLRLDLPPLTAEDPGWRAPEFHWHPLATPRLTSRSFATGWAPTNQRLSSGCRQRLPLSYLEPPPRR